MEDDAINKLKLYLETEEGQKEVQEYFDEMFKKEEMAISQLVRFHEKYNDENKFSKIVEKIISKYDSYKYRDREYNLGREPMEDLYFFLYEYAEKYGSEPTDEEFEIHGNDFTSGLYKIHGYFFNLMCGQGSCIKISKE